MIRTPLTVINKLGLHARAAARVVETASSYNCAISFSLAGREVDAKSIMGIMMLGATNGTRLEAMLSGADEVAAREALVALFEDRFGEPE
jgi:phosphocarrier protein